MNKEQIQQELKKTYDLITGQGYHVAYIVVYGSQNYELDIHTDEYQSDLDMKAIIIPTLDELVYCHKPISHVIEIPTGECDVKDIRVFMDVLVKANPAYLETLFSPYYIINPEDNELISWMRENAESLVHSLSIQVIRAIYGMALEKQKALCTPYTSKVSLIEQYGGDGKQSSHALRLEQLAQSFFIDKRSYAESLIPIDKDLLIEHKLHHMSLQEMETACSKAINNISDIRNLVSSTDSNNITYCLKEEYVLNSRNIIINKITRDIKKGASANG